jgi:hypothetical protein
MLIEASTHDPAFSPVALLLARLLVGGDGNHDGSGTRTTNLSSRSSGSFDSQNAAHRFAVLSPEFVILGP